MVFFYQRFINLNYRVENSHTDYVLVKSPQYQQALDALAATGYEIE